MTEIRPTIENSWLQVLSDEFKSEYFKRLKDFLVEEKKLHKIFPPGSEIFSAFNHTPFSKVKVVILGQDPYHGPGQANGLCFSVHKGIRKPPSLQNIFKELNSDLHIPIPMDGDLTKWASNGVLLLNATLTVRAKQAGSHQNRGWEEFTNTTISKLSDNKKNLVFILWGRFAQAKAGFIDQTRHQIITSAHPSPFSADKGFYGSKPFSRTNEYLKEHKIEPIDWNL